MGLSLDRRWLLGAIVLAVLARSALLAPRVSGPLDDPDNYLPLARSLSEGRGFEIAGRPSAYRPPLYPVILAPIVKTPERFQPWGIAALHLALGAGTVWLVWRTGLSWGLGTARAGIAAVVVALDPVLVVQSRSVMTETLAAFLLAGSLQALGSSGWKSCARSGVWFGLAGLCRPSTLACWALAVAAGLVRGPGRWGERVWRSMAMIVATLAVLSPWAIRNAMVFGEPVWTTTHGGYTLALANNPEYYRDVLNGPAGAVWSGPGQKDWARRLYRTFRGLGEPKADRGIRRQAVAFIREHPRDFVRASLARLSRFWGLAPEGAVYSWRVRLAALVWTLPFWAAVAAGLTARRLWTWPNVAVVSQILALSVVHTVFWTDLRMRAPVVPALALAAVHAGLGRRGKARLAENPKNP